MELINTIEISPYTYASQEYVYPDGSSKEFPEEWNQFWIKCISGKNLGGLKAIEKGSYLVDIEIIKEHELEEILKQELSEIEIDDVEEQLSRLSGGIVVKEGNEILLKPTCCGDIGNIQEWENIFEAEASQWHQLWIGHPWIFYKRENGLICFSDYTDSNLKDLTDIKAG
jgi:hypothetical protein